MRFLVDESTGPNVARWLRDQGHDVYSIYEQARGAVDHEIIQKACTEGWILVTNDKDFGELIYRENHPHKGVILLRLSDERSGNKISVMKELLSHHIERLSCNFVVVTETAIRFARRS